MVVLAKGPRCGGDRNCERFECFRDMSPAMSFARFVAMQKSFVLLPVTQSSQNICWIGLRSLQLLNNEARRSLRKGPPKGVDGQISGRRNIGQPPYRRTHIWCVPIALLLLGLLLGLQLQVQLQVFPAARPTTCVCVCVRSCVFVFTCSCTLYSRINPPDPFGWVIAYNIDSWITDGGVAFHVTLTRF